MIDPVEISIGSRKVGDGHPCYVIAEAGSNHNRDFGMARRLIDVAAQAGADAVKFQTFTGRTLYSRRAKGFRYLEGVSDLSPAALLESLELPRDWHTDLADHSAACGIEFLSSPFDRDAVDQLDALDVAAFKVASFELVDLPLIRYIGERRRPVILSTGMATLGEIEDALEAARAGGTDQLAVLQCASVYPAPATSMNLRAISTLKAAFRLPVGLSDHSLGIHIPVAAVALGADLLEKHFTLDRTLPGPDHSFAIQPDELRCLVEQVREVEAALGDGVKAGPTPAEAEEMFAKARRSVVAAVRIPEGHRIQREMLTVKRPGFGIKPKFIDALVGRTATTTIEEDEVITWDMV
ncbi:MAG: N-acetylneuraminate synthase family protein [Acidimicrobiales bacterium]